MGREKLTPVGCKLRRWLLRGDFLGPGMQVGAKILQNLDFLGAAAPHELSMCRGCGTSVKGYERWEYVDCD